MIKAIIFDLDDTLLMTRHVAYRALLTTAKKYYKLSINDNDIDKLYGIPFTNFIENYSEVSKK